MTDELKACPGCGCSGERSNDTDPDDTYLIEFYACVNCSFKADTLEDWNRRAATTEWKPIAEASRKDTILGAWKVTKDIWLISTMDWQPYKGWGNGMIQQCWTTYAPTHWMPLPLPPFQTKDESNGSEDG